MSHLQVVPGGDSRNKQTRLALYLIGGVAAFGCLAFILFITVVLPQAGDASAAKRAVTQTNLALIGQSLRTYAEEHDGRLPTAATWEEKIRPYLDNPKILNAPPESNESARVGYFMNPAASEAKLNGLKGADPGVIIYEIWIDDPSGRATPLARGGKYTALYTDFNVRSDENAPALSTPLKP